MIHMLSCFDLKPDMEIDSFRSAYLSFFKTMKNIDLVENTGPVGRRRRDTPLDTDDEREHEYFVIMTFRDQGQVDAAYEHIQQHIEPGHTSHDVVLSQVANSVFICWEDLPDIDC